MKRKNRSQRGYALISAMAVGVVALSMTGVIMLRMTASTSQIAQRESIDEAKSISESVLNDVLDTIADITSKETDAIGSGTTSGIFVSASALADYMLHNDVLNASANSSNTGTSSIQLQEVTSGLPSDYGTGESFTSSGFWDSLQGDKDHSSEFWAAFRKNSDDTALGALNNLTVGSTTVNDGTLEALHKLAYKVYRVKRGSDTADVVISIVPLANDISDLSEEELHSDSSFANHHDVFKIRVATYMPALTSANVGNPRNMMDVIVNRPVLRNNDNNYSFDHAILAGGTVDMGNWDTTSGPCAGVGGGACIDEDTNGDIHTNGNLVIGSNGHVQGKATATGTVTAKTTVLPSSAFEAGTGDPRETNGDVTSRIDNPTESRSGADEVPIPEIELGVDGLGPCVDTNPDPQEYSFANCAMAAGDFSLGNHHYSVEFSGTVHIQGNYSNKGSQRCIGSTPCRVVIDGTADVGGNGVSNFYSQQESLYVVRGLGATAGTTCLDMGGNPDAYGTIGTLYYVENPNCHTTFRGTSEFFGGLITHGSFAGNGNSTSFGVQRDSDMSSLSDFIKASPIPKKDLFPAVISWKDLR